MRLLLVTDAWLPQVNGVVTTLVELVDGMRRRGHVVTLIEPSAFRRYPCPGYRKLELAWRPGPAVRRTIDAGGFDAIHIATEGPIGSAARAHGRRRGLRFTTAFHTRFPDIIASALHVPASWGYAWFRRWHSASAGVLVPSEGMAGVLRGYRFENLRAWSHGVDLRLFEPVPDADFGLPRPVFLYVGRVSYEKNLTAFLELDLPGSKVVYGVGPMLQTYQRKYGDVHWRGIVARSDLARVYSAADAFVFPSHADTFGLVMLEALACGTPVAAFPVPGPLDVIGSSDAGVLADDLQAAALAALHIPRERARARALCFDWEAVCDQFIGHLVPARTAERGHQLLMPSPMISAVPTAKRDSSEAK